VNSVGETANYSYTADCFGEMLPKLILGLQGKGDATWCVFSLFFFFYKCILTYLFSLGINASAFQWMPFARRLSKTGLPTKRIIISK
jgi:hypothetical protein